MGIFGGGYMKEGPGIDKNAPKKKGIFLYIDIVFRKFMDLMGTGFMCFIISLPFLAFTYVILSSFIMNGLGISAAIESTARSMAGEGADAEELAQMLYFSMRSMITIIVYNFFGSGPVSASYAFITRCFTRGEHVWKMSDGWDKFKENLKQTIALLILDIVVISLASNAIAFYSALAAANTGSMATLLTVAQCFTAVILVLYMMMHIYIYQIMVTYECSFIDLIKSSITIAIAKLPMSVLLTAVTGAVIFALLGMISNPMIGIIIYAVLGHIVLRYPLEFYASRVIEKNIKAVKKQEKKNRAKITYLDAE
ncbi:MAG: hypothetical protein ACI4DP_03780 [Candidatus Ornithomonoglobus sp.]